MHESDSWIRGAARFDPRSCGSPRLDAANITSSASSTPACPASTYTRIGIPDTGVDLIGAKDDQTLFFYDRSPATFGADRYCSPTRSRMIEVSSAPISRSGAAEPMVDADGHHGGPLRALSANRGFGPLENDTALLGEGVHQPERGHVREGPRVHGTRLHDQDRRARFRWDTTSMSA